MDLGIEVILTLFSKQGLEEVFTILPSSELSENALRILALKNDYLKTIDDVIQFLQGKQPTLARQICSGNFLPQASRFNQLGDLEWSFGAMGMQDKAKHLATLYLEDLSDFIVECIDEHFGFSRYAERLGRSANSFDELHRYLQQELTFIDKITLQILKSRMVEVNPKLVCFSVPFPGNLYSAFRCAQFIKANYPEVKVAMGGGFPNTELRSLTDVRVFNFFDFITLDDGELPVELLINFVVKGGEGNEFKRTFLEQDGEVAFIDNALQHDYKQSEVGTPDYSDLFLDRYISVIEVANPMHSLWSDGRWNKLTMAHGCYWGKCTFCDISLDYIKLYEPIAAKLLVDRMEELIDQTGEKGFHFVDEAAPPALMRELALEILRRKLTVTWWTNIRFEKSFTLDLCHLLKASGCIAVSGGLEVASDRLLKLIQKGVTVEQVARVTSHFTEASIMVHAYLMYGYPTQTEQETIDSLEMVRQMFELGIIQSAFWHQFALTAHSPIGLNPEAYGILPAPNEISFANNDIEFTDSTGIDHSKFSYGLKKSLYNYMHDMCFDFDLQEWFEFKVPRISIHSNYIRQGVESEEEIDFKVNAKLIWIGNIPSSHVFTKVKKGKSTEFLSIGLSSSNDATHIVIERKKGEWILGMLSSVELTASPRRKLEELRNEYETRFGNFENFWFSDTFQELRNFGLLLV